jgi:hypothetical protein
MVIEHVDLYEKMDRVPEGDLDYIIPPVSRRSAAPARSSQFSPISTWSTCRSGRGGYGHRRRGDRSALARHGVHGLETIGESIKKTNNVLLVDRVPRPATPAASPPRSPSASSTTSISPCSGSTARSRPDDLEGARACRARLRTRDRGWHRPRRRNLGQQA